MSTEEFLQNAGISRIDRLEDFTRIQVMEDLDTNFYQDLKAFIESYDGEVSIANGIAGSASKEEFIQAEKIIEELVSKINPDWTEKQKIACVHYQIGKLISYVPDFNFRGKYANSSISTDTRNIWKSILTGESVCNGITSITRNILSRIGINTRELSSETHSFVLAETEDGNIIIDPTWDLKNTLYGARPMYFGKTYEQLREVDGEFSNAHKLEEPPEDVIEISDSELREIYYSLGHANEDRTFIFPILDKVSEIQSREYSINEKLQAFFDMFTQDFSEECTHLSETRTLLEQCMYEFGIEPKDLTTKFVYAKEDENCTNPYLCMYINNEQIQNQIRLLDVDMMQFQDLDINEFDKKYMIHNLDTAKPFWKKYLPEAERDNNEVEK